MAQQYHLVLNNPEVISWAKRFLKKSNRIVWYLKQIKLTPSKHPSLELAHYFGMNIPQVNEFDFKEESLNEILSLFKNFEAVYLKKQTESDKLIEVDPLELEIISFDDGFAWVNLNKASCEKEAQCMGHCGNSSGDLKDQVLSLRKRVIRSGKKYWRPHLTFVLGETGYLGEMKGRQNERPQAKYHKYILELLNHPLVKGINEEGFLPENNFKLQDLSNEDLNSFMDNCSAKIPPEECAIIRSTNKLEVFLKSDFTKKDYRVVNKCLAWLDKDSDFFTIYEQYPNVSVRELAIRRIRDESLLMKIVYNNSEGWFFRDAAAQGIRSEEGSYQVINYLRQEKAFPSLRDTHRGLVDNVYKQSYVQDILMKDWKMMSEGHHLFNFLEKVDEDFLFLNFYNFKNIGIQMELAYSLTNPENIVSIINDDSLELAVRRKAYYNLWVKALYRQNKKLNKIIVKKVKLLELPNSFLCSVVNSIKNPVFLCKILFQVLSRIDNPLEEFKISKSFVDRILGIKSHQSLLNLQEILKRTSNQMVKNYIEYQISEKNEIDREKYETAFTEMILSLETEEDACYLMNDLFISPNDGASALKRIENKTNMFNIKFRNMLEQGLSHYEKIEKMLSTPIEHNSSYNHVIVGMTGSGKNFLLESIEKCEELPFNDK